MSIQKEIKETLEKATPGTWMFRKTNWTPGDGEFGDKEFCVGELRHEVKPKHYHTILEPQKNKYGQHDLYAWNEHDAHLIANAPTWLLHQQEHIEQKNQFNTELCKQILELESTVKQKDAEIARLTEQRNRTLSEWGKTLDDAEILAAQLEKGESL